MHPLIGIGIAGLALAIPLVVLKVLSHLAKKSQEEEFFIGEESLRDALIREGRGHEPLN